MTGESETSHADSAHRESFIEGKEGGQGREKGKAERPCGGRERERKWVRFCLLKGGVQCTCTEITQQATVTGLALRDGALCQVSKGWARHA